MTKRVMVLQLLLVCVQVAFLSLLLAGWSSTYDTATPPGSDPPATLDDRIREAKEALQERQNVDHYWPLTGTQVSDADAGKHRKVTFQGALAADPTLDPDEGAVYAKAVSGVTELFWKDENGAVKQLTSGGKLNVAATEAVLSSGDQSVGGTKTFTGTPVFTAGFTVGQNTDIGNYSMEAKSFTSDVATGTAPIVVTSTTKATNLNADMVDGCHVGSMLGTWATTDSLGNPFENDHSYLAQADGLIMVNAYGSVYTDGVNPPVTWRAGSNYASSTCPVKSGHYVKTAGSTSTFWIPFGTGALVKQ